MEDSAQPNNGKPQQVNLQQIAQQFMSGLQRHFDMLAFNLASRESVQEEAYDRYAHTPKIMPSAASHQNFEQMQAYAQDLLVRQVIGDSMNLAVTGMNNAHFFLALVKSTNAQAQVSPEAQQQAQKAQKAFVSAPMDQKFNMLEADYGIMCELEDSIVSLGFCLQALMQHGGIVQNTHTDEHGELVVDLKTLKILGRTKEGGKAQGKLVDQRKIFKEGEVLTFSELDLQLVLVTIASFADALFKSVAQYAKTIKEGGA